MISVSFLSLSLLNYVFSYNKAATVKKAVFKANTIKYFFQIVSTCCKLLTVMSSMVSSNMTWGSMFTDRKLCRSMQRGHSMWTIVNSSYNNQCGFMFDKNYCYYDLFSLSEVVFWRFATSYANFGSLWSQCSCQRKVCKTHYYDKSKREARG